MMSTSVGRYRFGGSFQDRRIYRPRVRVIEARVGDGTNTKRTTVEYTENLITGQVLYNLPKTIQVYDSSLSTVIKKVQTEYNFDSAYTSRRIIGLPSKTEAWGWNDLTSSLEYVSKATYEYDYDDDFATSGLNQNISPVQHDNTNFGASFSPGPRKSNKDDPMGCDQPDKLGACSLERH